MKILPVEDMLFHADGRKGGKAIELILPL